MGSGARWNAPRQRYLRQPADLRAPLHDAPHLRYGQGVDGHADAGEGKDRRRPHRIDIGDRIGRGNAAEVEGIVDDGHEKIGGGHQGQIVAKPQHGRVVRGGVPDEQVRVGEAHGHPGQGLL
jgi:hypothetical protein